MSNPYFAFKQFTVYQDRCAMKVGTDGVLLGAWTNVEGMKRILDVGTGTGLIALMLAQRSGALIDAVEIDRDSAEQALQNVKSSPWPDRINVYHTSFQCFTAGSIVKYNLIVSNPPFFQQALKSPDKARTMARHDAGLSLQSLLFYAGSILLPDGKLSTIIPSDSIEVFTHQAYLNGFYPERIVKLLTTAYGKPSRIMIELSRAKQHEHSVSFLTIMQEDSHGYTEEYRMLTKEFYL